jgi:hypothetical protein
MRWGEVGGMEVAGVEAMGGDESRVSLVVALDLDAVDGLGGDLSVIPGQGESRGVVVVGGWVAVMLDCVVTQWMGRRE